ncbi:MAG: hypothetical protein IT233_08720 [Bacteroidia bacterium]|nr:hypothetical protein [Bacteroidia bacterium]
MPKLSTPENFPTLSDTVKADDPKPEILNENFPRPHVLKNILSYSVSLNVKESEYIGQVRTTSN